MARPRKTQDNDVAEATGTVQARHKAERERQRTARTARAELAAETSAAQAATAKRLASKPTDTRTIT